MQGMDLYSRVPSLRSQKSGGLPHHGTLKNTSWSYVILSKGSFIESEECSMFSSKGSFKDSQDDGGVLTTRSVDSWKGVEESFIDSQ